MMFLEFWEIVLAMALAVGWAMFAEAKKAEINKLKSQILSLQESNLHWRNEAAKGCRVRASNGDHQAMLALGMIYLDGVDSQMTARNRANEGDEPDYWSALDWFQRAADCGNPIAAIQKPCLGWVTCITKASCQIYAKTQLKRLIGTKEQQEPDIRKLTTG